MTVHSVKYIVDSNFFIQAHRMSYPLDIAVGFWNAVKQLADSGVISSIDKVRDEIYKNDDELKLWMTENLPNDFFHSTKNVLSEYAILANWANSKSSLYNRKAIDDFLNFDEADAWLIAYCKAHALTLVTQELVNTGSKKKIKIPDVCIENSVNYCDLITMFRNEGVRF